MTAKRLTIVVPYRDRAEHFRIFVPTLRAYFARDKIDRNVPYQVFIVEQDNALPFNRGALSNIGFLLGQGESDYTCFHDIDYIPIWADYSWSEFPAPIVWYGAESQPISAARPDKKIFHNLDEFFGAVMIVPNDQFVRVNGYANSYWGWGYEDEDLKWRFKAANIPCTRRKGTFDSLRHDNRGYNEDGSSTPAALANDKIFKDRWMNGGPVVVPQPDGLISTFYEILDRSYVPEEFTVERGARWEKVTVRLKMQPSSEQIKAALGTQAS